ncbi:hypothetical protein SOCEGT47_016630 [Sorangium cellulosum]|uniref:IrrE N-terminal-like domain-containing protein n=2 Tax=Sorangium cellulosum TaxID=56 RepID=A0A4P2PWL7_SORCE|nr:hypothetical protein SOCEGT47_016630 [Sorangium cellulosum]
METQESTSTIMKPGPMSKKEKIKNVLEMVSLSDYEELIKRTTELFDLEYNTVESHPNNIKAVIKYKTFTFREGLSLSSKTFMILHSLGHYYFISNAKRKKNTRYEYIYDKEGTDAPNLHLYKNLGEEPRVVTDKMRKDRIDFEVGANNFGIELLRHLGMEHLSPVVSIYQAGDVNYILDVTAHGKDAIVPTDYDYLDRYICNGLTYEEEPNDEDIFAPEEFSIHGTLDWPYLDHLKLEVHFF